ncbi:PorT family protein [Flavobacterium sp. MFBS3-15]|uniref:PorT family protein n=1 Tax=Flavobacterium sp. MFBS3-15 TaxID=2989816 RepID=UPI002235FC3C|nr:PorT family protein [Flavobacterium sp. MFBS3-15]MCW4470867.1 PorT family protein [Flavobacterium sp. MFBS3-15]
MMKKLFFTAMLLAGTFAASAQETKFGVRAGVDFASMKVTYVNPITGDEASASSSETGFFIGAFAEFGLSEKFSIQPEALYVSIKDFNSISVPVLGKYSFGSFSVLAGPDLNYLLDAEEDEFKVNIDLGASYDITESFDVQARYSIGMGDVALSGMFIGAGYAF